MIGEFEIIWSEQATQDWLRLSLEEATLVARAVRRFAESGEGMVVHVDGEFRLFADDHVVVFLVAGAQLHVDRVFTNRR